MKGNHCKELFIGYGGKLLVYRLIRYNQVKIPISGVFNILRRYF